MSAISKHDSPNDNVGLLHQSKTVKGKQDKSEIFLYRKYIFLQNVFDKGPQLTMPSIYFQTCPFLCYSFYTFDKLISCDDRP